MVKRPIINTRDEPHADREKYRRLHVIVGDANMSEYTIYLRNGATAIVLAMIEDGAITREPVAARSGARDQGGLARPDLQARAPARRRQALTAVADPGRVPRDGARATTAQQSLDPITKDVLAKWEHVLDALERDPMELAETDRLGDEEGDDRALHGAQVVDWSSPQVQMLDLQYHDLRPEKGLYYLLERQGQRRAHRRPTTRSSRAIHTAAGGHAGVFPRGVSQEVRSGGVRRQLGLDLVRRRRRADQARS